MMQFDGTLETLMNSELAVALLINRHDHSLIMLEAAQHWLLAQTLPVFETPDAGEGRSLGPSVGSRCQLTKC